MDPRLRGDDKRGARYDKIGFVRMPQYFFVEKAPETGIISFFVFGQLKRGAGGINGNQ